MRQFMPDRLDGKTILTNTVTAKDVDFLRDRGIARLVTTTPDFGGRSFGTNVVEAAMIALLGKKWADVTDEDYRALLERLDLEAARDRVPGRVARCRCSATCSRASRTIANALPSDGVPLRRVLGVRALIAVGLGTMLGGIFSTVGAGSNAAGPAVIVAFALSGLTCVFVALCYAELASMVPVAGSAYTYAYAALGEFVAWVIGWDLILEYGFSVAPLAATLSASLQQLLGNLGFALPAWAQTAHVAFANGGIDLAHSQVDVIAAVAIVLLAALLAIGIRESAGTNVGLVVIQLVALVAFVLVLAGAVHPAAVPPVRAARAARDRRERGAGVLRVHRLRHGHRRERGSARSRARRAARDHRLAADRRRAVHRGRRGRGRRRRLGQDRPGRRDARRGRSTRATTRCCSGWSWPER